MPAFHFDLFLRTGICTCAIPSFELEPQIVLITIPNAMGEVRSFALFLLVYTQNSILACSLPVHNSTPISGWKLAFYLLWSCKHNEVNLLYSIMFLFFSPWTFCPFGVIVSSQEYTGAGQTIRCCFLLKPNFPKPISVIYAIQKTF